MVSLNKSVLCGVLLCCYHNVLYLEKEWYQDRLVHETHWYSFKAA